MGVPPSPVLLDGGPGALLAGHVALAARAAQVVVLRTGGLALVGGSASPVAWWRSASLEDGEPRHDAVACASAAGIHHGVNRCGLLLAADPAGPVVACGLAGAVLGRAAGVEEAATLLAAAAPRLDGPDRVWLVDGRGGRCVELGPQGARLRELPAPEGTADRGLAAVRAALRDHGESGRCHHGGLRGVSALAARLARRAEPVVAICLGPPCCGVFVRHWPGIPAAPPLTAAGDLPPLLGSLAEVLAGVTEADPERRPAVAGTLAGIEAEVLAEGDEAERMAVVMDAAGDDHGAEVRRALAQAHAAGLAAAAMEAMCPGTARSPGHPIIESDRTPPHARRSTPGPL
jgi:hypothetical protein